MFSLTFGNCLSKYAAILYAENYSFHDTGWSLDDGPLPGRTEAVLDVLKEANVTATFFVCGQTYSDLHSVEGQATVRRIIAEV